MIMEKLEALPFVREAMSYGTFCKKYIRYREDLQSETSKLLLETLDAEQAYREFIQENAKFPELMRQLELETVQAEREAGSPDTPELDFSKLDNEEALEKDRIKKKYHEQKELLSKEKETAESTREMNNAFQNELFKMRVFYNRLKPYKDKAEERIRILKCTFPKMAAEIDRMLSEPLEELTEKDYRFEKELDHIQKSGNASEPVSYLEMLDYIIRPSLYPFEFFSEKDFAFARSGMALLMLAGVIGGFTLSPFLIPLSCVIAFIVPIVLAKKNNSMLTKEFDAAEVELWHTVLSFKEEDIERFARRNVGLPSISADDFREQCEEQLEKMSEKLDRAVENEKWLKSMIDADEENTDILKQLTDAQKKCSELSAEINSYRLGAQDMEFRLRRIEGAGKGSLEERMQNLERSEQLELERLKEDYRSKRETETNTARLEKERQANEKLEELKQKRESLLKEKADTDNMARLSRNHSKQLRAEYERMAAMLKRFDDPVFWNSNFELWKKNSGTKAKTGASKYFVPDFCYVIGPLGPYKLEHDCRPCVLIYDSDSYEDSQWLLGSTLKAIQSGISISTNPALVQFALVCDFPESAPRLQGSVKAYGNRRLEQLERQISDMLKKLQYNSGSYGQTVRDFNINFSKEMSGTLSIETTFSLMLKTMFVFVLPPKDMKSRPMDNDMLWEKLHGDCFSYGFVPLFFIPKNKWENKSGSDSSGFAKAVDELHNIAKNRVFNIQINTAPVKIF